ncbi:hypothetical protein SDC9_120348 [bioreactor metagenome]|uniref:4Fe-4S ferredoxin-type domain-containing protein n=1 Tax=bioreactor metagenome TaxID=1076179 RepID=A0A645C7K9_9ZZZZ
MAETLQQGLERFGSPVSYTSNWSERHVAYVCGLGTFSLSKGLITEKGVSGRFGSLVTTAPLTVTPRAYSELYEYCVFCGACARNCPAEAIAIDPEVGKRHAPCAAFLDEYRPQYAPRYGCGKCQVRVPCRDGIPRRKSAV